MPFSLPALPYEKNALTPYMSAETLEFHYEKHHAAYVKNLNQIIAKTGNFVGAALETIIQECGSGALFNNAAQHWNHTFFWNCLSPNRHQQPSGKLRANITSCFGSYEAFQSQFSAAARAIFGSGWAWLVQKPDGKLAIVQKANAGNPLTDGDQPLLTCDVWEHAYYLDYRNRRAAFIDAYWQLANWDFVDSVYASMPFQVGVPEETHEAHQPESRPEMGAPPPP